MKYFSCSSVKMMSVIIALVLVVVGIACGKRGLEPEVYIPAEMPVTLDVSRDEQATEKIKYIIHSKVGPEVDEVKMWLFTTDTRHEDGTHSGNFIMAVTNKAARDASIEWERTQDVRRLIVIVQSVKTLDGVWVLDLPDINQFPMREVLDKGAAALPKAKFLKDE